MKKYWLIDGNTFFVRDNAKEFLAVEWNRDPEKYLRDENIVSYFNDYLCENKYYCLDSWLLKTSRATETQLKEMQNTVKQFFADQMKLLKMLLMIGLQRKKKRQREKKKNLMNPILSFTILKKARLLSIMANFI